MLIIRQFLRRRCDYALGVPEQHHGVIERVELIVDSREAGVHRSFDGDDGLGLVGVEDWHSVNRRAFVVTGGGVDDVVGADDQGHVGLREIVIDGVHLDELVVGNFRLGQQDIHVAGHAAGNRVNRETNVHASAGQLIV